MQRNAHLERLRSKLAKLAPESDLEALAHKRNPNEGAELSLETFPPTVSKAPASDELIALTKIKNGDFQDLSATEQFQLEAIVEEEGRPVAFIANSVFEPLPAPWTHYNQAPVRAVIETATRSIGRVELAGATPTDPAIHVGTGFIVGPNLMMTNRHVAEVFVQGVGSKGLSFVSGRSPAIGFKREKDFPRVEAEDTVQIVEIVMVHPFWDMALLKVRGLPSGVKPLDLSVLPPEKLFNNEVAVIGYPARSRDRSPKAVELEKKVFGTTFGVKRLQPGEIVEREDTMSFDHLVPAMTHDSSTLPGNSGSAVLDIKSGEVVGLHFAGVTLKANYSVPTYELARDKRVVDAGVTFQGSAEPTNDWLPAWKKADAESAAATKVTSHVTPAVTPNVVPVSLAGAGGGGVTWTIPLNITVSLGAIVSQVTAITAPAALAGRTPAQLTEASFQIPVIFEHLEERTGYDPDFLDLEDGKPVPLPKLTAAGQALVSTLEDGTFELKYHRFSVVMHKKRRMALFTASNVNWQRAERLVDGRKPTREQLTGIPEGVLEEWVLDPRIPEEHQLPDLFFTKDGGAFDKGHLVRRDDVAWGSSFEDMQKGNGDTYHVTNCSPQVGLFNQAPKGVDNWGDLETMIQQQTKAERVIVFSGPVLALSDRIFKGIDESGPARIQIPKKFWKIVVANTDDGPRAYGFILQQKLSTVPLEFAVPDEWATHHRPIAEIEDLLGGLVSLKWCKARDGHPG